MNKTTVLIFSYHRPLQLDACLRSLQYNCDDYTKLDIKVLYKTDDEKYDFAYNQITSEYPLVQFIHETNFQTHIAIAMMEYEYIMFVTDDTIFTRNFSIKPIEKLLKTQKNVFGFSLRLGLQLNYCYSLNKTQKIPVFWPINKTMILWDWKQGEVEWNYPFEVSSSVFRVSDVMEKFYDRQCPNPNYFEWIYDTYYKNDYYTKYPLMACYNIGVAFANPINKVRVDNQNRSGQKFELNIENLLKKYQSGYRIDIKKLKNFDNIACHQEVDFEYEEKNDS
jgi:hypothetical protein